MPDTQKTDPSIDDLRSMLAADGVPVKDAKEAPLPAVAAEPIVATGKPETGEGTPAEDSQQPKEAKPKETKPAKVEDDELPEGVRKKIEKEVARTAEANRKITEAVSARKAAEAELEKVAKGSEPVKKTEATDPNPRPVRPKMQQWVEEFTAKHNRAPVNEEWNDALAEHEERLAAWFDARSDERAKVASKAVVEQELTAREQADLEKQRKAAADALWQAGVKAHGAEALQSAAQTVRKVTTEPMQVAISEMDDWAGISMKLASDPEALDQFVQAWKESPARAVRQLVLIEQSLKPPVAEIKEKPANSVKTLPRPAMKVGGSASVTGKQFDPHTANLEEVRELYNAEMRAR